MLGAATPSQTDSNQLKQTTVLTIMRSVIKSEGYMGKVLQVKSGLKLAVREYMNMNYGMILTIYKK